MRITITGATGFIGRRLIQSLSADAHEVVALVRNTLVPLGNSVNSFWWDGLTGEPPVEAFADGDAIVHLAGEPVAQRWTAAVKRRLRDSRVEATQNLLAAVARVAPSRRPKVLLSASAVGYYGSRGDEVLTEAAAPGTGFLADLCGEWEREADRAAELGLRVVRIRTGVVLGRDGGALAKMTPPFRAGVGGPLGSGKQWMPWIHLDDLVAMMRYALDHPVSGAWNGVAPNPVTNAQFTRALGAALDRPAILPVPALAIRLLCGEMAGVLLSSQRVVPKAAEAAGFRFRYPELPAALAQIFAH